jgi:hypothetical protein
MQALALQPTPFCDHKRFYALLRQIAERRVRRQCVCKKISRGCYVLVSIALRPICRTRHGYSVDQALLGHD